LFADFREGQAQPKG